jgi:hypothetical protein
MFEGYLGQALCVARLLEQLTKEQVLSELNKRLGANLSLEIFDGMERDIEEIDIATFDAWCGLFRWSRERVLQCAQNLKQNARRSDKDTKESMEEVLRELDYEQWRENQNN